MKTTVSKKLDVKSLDKIISGYRGKSGELLSVLEDAQKLTRRKFLSPEVLEYIAKKTNIPLSRIYSVVTFYAFFNLKPQGEHTIILCRGTACHTRRSKNLLEYLVKLLDLEGDGTEQGEKLFLTTRDNKFTVRTVACFGQCALAPVVEVDGKIYGHMTEDKLRKIVQQLSRGGKKR